MQRSNKLIILLILLNSCAQFNQSQKRHHLQQIYQGSGIEQYYLPEMPIWANFSTVAQCSRKTPIRYLNFETLHKSYNLDYQQLIQFQLLFNQKLENYRQETSHSVLYLQDEAFYFYNSYEQIVGGTRSFNPPRFHKVNLIWMDAALNSEANLKKLQSFMQTDKASSAHPIFVSTCLSSAELDKFIKDHHFDKFGVKSISQEMFGPYGVDFHTNQMYSLDFTKILPEKELHFYGPWLPKEFIGISKYRSY